MQQFTPTIKYSLVTVSLASLAHPVTSALLGLYRWTRVTKRVNNWADRDAWSTTSKGGKDECNEDVEYMKTISGWDGD